MLTTAGLGTIAKMKPDLIPGKIRSFMGMEAKQEVKTAAVVETKRDWVGVVITILAIAAIAVVGAVLYRRYRMSSE